MDFSWMPHLGFWIFLLLCVLFMALMMFGCHGMRSRCCSGTKLTAANRADERRPLSSQSDYQSGITPRS